MNVPILQTGKLRFRDVATVWEVLGLGLETRSLFSLGALAWVSCPGMVSLARQPLAKSRARRAG